MSEDVPASSATPPAGWRNERMEVACAGSSGRDSVSATASNVAVPGASGNDRAELAFLMVASAAWAKPHKFLALAYCRRTWCHHLVLDFLAVRPGVSFANQPIRGIGSGILATLAGLADSLSMETMWGEATASSAAFYEKVLKIYPVKDLFVLQPTACTTSHNATSPSRSTALPKWAQPSKVTDLKAVAQKTQTDAGWLRECFDYEATHPVAFASPRALLEARMIEAMDKARRPQRRARRNGAAPRRKAVTA